MKGNAGWNAANILLLAAGLLFTAVPGWSQSGLPEGNGKATVEAICTQCHGLNRITRAELNAPEWENIVYDMVARGAPLYEEELDVVTQYLVENFAKKNTAKAEPEKEM